jgi:hypothetical protein
MQIYGDDGTRSGAGRGGRKKQGDEESDFFSE